MTSRSRAASGASWATCAAGAARDVRLGRLRREVPAAISATPGWRGARRSSGPMSRLEALGVTKRFRLREVVKDLSLSIESGQVVGLLGPNGAGKTTAFYMI